MKRKEKQVEFFVIENLLKIMNDKELSQSTVAEYANIDPSQMSKILKGSIQLSLRQLANIARGLKMRISEICEYPNIYEIKKLQQEPVKFLLGIELQQNGKIDINQFCLNNILTIN